jgi:hypothetical protein
MTFATDVDLLHWEPNLLREAGFASQTLLSGTADLEGTTITLTGGSSLLDSKVQPDHVLYLGGPVDGSFPIVRVDSATELTLSVMYDALFPGQGDGEAAPAGSATSVPFAIRTFWPQRRITSELLLQAAGLRPEQAHRILNPGSLKRACTLGTLHMIYSALSAAAPDASDFSVRADLYERLYRRALRSARVEIDLDSDGSAECVRPLNVMSLQRR